VTLLALNFSFYTSTPAANQSFNRQVYSSNGCLSCDLRTPEGNLCTYASATFSKDFSHYVLTCSGPDPSFTRIYKTAGREEIVKWEENTDLRTRLAAKVQPQIKIFHVPIEGGFNGVVRMLLPTDIDFDKNDGTKKYSMIVRVYAGPGSIAILNNFAIGFQTYQATKKNIIYVQIDGRGMSQNGNDMMFTVNNRLGSVEIEDQIAVTKYLIDKFKFIDPARVAIWGW
jgi:dipeptidyl-peptidase 4